jgi:hypothetical protein
LAPIQRRSQDVDDAAVASMKKSATTPVSSAFDVSCLQYSMRGGSMPCGGLQLGDLVLQFELFELEPGNLRLVGRGPGSFFGDPLIEHAVLIRQLHQMRWHCHQVLLGVVDDTDSLAELQHWSTGAKITKCGHAESLPAGGTVCPDDPHPGQRGSSRGSSRNLRGRAFPAYSRRRDRLDATQTGHPSGEVGAKVMESQGERDKKLRGELAQLLQKHRVFDETIGALEQSLQRDQLQITRLKRQKLKLKDQISLIEDQLLPDIIA